MRSEKGCKSRVVNSKVVKAIIIVMGSIITLQFFFTIGINITESIPNKVFLIIKGMQPEINDFVAFRFQGSRYYRKGKTFIKVFAGKEGDHVESVDRTLLLNKRPVAVAKERDREGKEIEPFAFNGVIPPNKILVLGISKDSYDSRYFGLIDKRQIIGRAIALF